MKSFSLITVILSAFIYATTDIAYSATPIDNLPETVYCKEIALKRVGMHQDKIIFKMAVLCNNPTGFRVYMASRGTGLVVKDIYSVDTLEELSIVTFFASEAEVNSDYIVLKKNPS